MPRNANVAITNSFVGGRFTEATGVNFPPNVCVDELNCVFNKDGSTQRRPGFDFETSFTTKTIDREAMAVSTYLWKNAGDGNIDLAVQQVGDTLHFYLTNNTESLSSGSLATTIDLNTFTPAGGDAPDANECQFSVGLGYLFVTHPLLDSFYCSFDGTTQIVTATEIAIQIRDLEGTSDGLVVDNRPLALTDAHEYNLLNQGWDTTKISAWNASESNYPSNADVWWVFRDATTDVFDPSVESDFNRGNSPAPKGHFILDAFLQDRDAAGGVSGITDVTSGGKRPSVVAFHSGRVWYSGVEATGFNTKIYFSQTIEGTAEFGKCYQRLDPTSETLFDLLPTDGGYINIPEAGFVYGLEPFGNFLLVRAHNGVWAIAGSEGVGFTATDYSVSFVSSVRSISNAPAVRMEGTPLWWNTDGIYTVTLDQSGGIRVQSITDEKIKSFFREIPYLSKRQVKGCYDPFQNRIHWLYRSEAAADIQTGYEYDRVLNLNTLTGAFYLWSIPTSGDVRVNSVLMLDTGAANAIDTEIVVDGLAVPVTAADGSTVVIYGLADLVVLRSVPKFLVSYEDGSSYKFTWAEVFDEDNVDWASHEDEGISYESYFVPAYTIPTQLVQKFQGTYLHVVSRGDADTTYRVQAQWNFTNTGSSGKWSTQNLITNTNNQYDYIRSRIKLRGSGHSLALKYSSVDNEPFDIVGWSLFQTGNMSP